VLNVINKYTNSETIGGSGNMVCEKEDEGAVDSKNMK
jgi:hypothetical protein